MNTVKNIIRKQTVNFHYNGNTDAFVLQKEVSDWCKFKLIPEIEQQLELFDVGNHYISIDRLAVDASIDKKDWQQKIRNELISTLNQKLRDYKPVSLKDADKAKNENRLHKLDELILFYFEKGYLPWWSKAFVENGFTALLAGWVAEEKSPARCDEIIFKLQQINSSTVIQRILNQVYGKSFFKLLHDIFRPGHNAISEAESFIQILLKSVLVKASKKKIVLAFNELILTSLIKHTEKIDVDLVVQVLRHIVKNETMEQDILFKTIPGMAIQQANPFIREWQSHVAEKVNGDTQKNGDIEKKEDKYRQDRKIEAVTNKLVAKNSMQQIQNAEELREGIYIENAGAVIVATFLPMLFDRLKITDKAKLVKPNLAVMIIQYIVSGKAKAEENELVLPKILCGISPGQHVNTAINITKPQQAEADEMLEALIAHWSILKGTSVQGLRESFLKRSGKLMQVEEEWLLQAEQKAYDMLLQQLPWSISMIKLPWMENVLKTEWV